MTELDLPTILKLARLYPVLDFGREIGFKVWSGEKFQPTIRNPRKKHAVLMLGDGGNGVLRETIENTSLLVYRTLLEKGYKPEDIFVLQGRETPGRNLNHSRLPLDTNHLDQVFQHLYQTVTQDDVFFLYSLGHGYRGGILPIGTAFLQLNNCFLNERDLERLLSDLHPDHSIMVFNSCFGGRLAETFGHDRNLAIAPCKPDKATKAQISPPLENGFGWYASKFTLSFFSALRGRTLDEEIIDLPNDSIKQAFEYAAKGSTTRLTTPFEKHTPFLFYGSINPEETIL